MHWMPTYFISDRKGWALQYSYEYLQYSALELQNLYEFLDT